MRRSESSTRPGSTPTATTLPFRHRWWPDAVVLALGAVVIRLPAFFAPTNLGYDDGGYGLAAVMMRRGYEPFRDLFSPQGPLFLPLVHLGDTIGLRATDAPRVLAVAAGAAGAVAAYEAGRELVDRGRALLAGALAATSGLLLWTTGPLTGDGPATAAAAATIAIALAYRRAPTLAKAIAIGLVAGLAISIKSLFVIPALLIAWLVVVTRGSRRDALLIPVLAVAVLVLAAVPWGIDNVWRDSVQYHLEKTGARDPLENLNKIVTTTFRRDTVMVAIGALGLVGALARRSRRPSPDDTGPDDAPVDGTSASAWDAAIRRIELVLAGRRVLWWWLGLTVVVLLLQQPMFRNHIASIAIPLALVVASWRPPWRWVAVAWLVALPFQAYELRDLLVPRDFDGDAKAVVDRMRTLPDGAWVITDEPGFVWRAGLGTEPSLVDASVLRIKHSTAPGIRITAGDVLRAAQKPNTCGVLVWSKQRFGALPDLDTRLRRIGYERVVELDGPRGLYVRPCQSVTG